MEEVKAALPDRAHVPGLTPRHPEGTFDVIRASAHAVTRSDTASWNPAFQAGLDFLESGFYWEAHEVLEPVWMNAPANAPERFMVQALIQMANAALKQAMGRPRAAQRLCAIARDLLARAGQAGAPVMGLDPCAVAAQTDRLDRAAAAGQPVALAIRPAP